MDSLRQNKSRLPVARALITDAISTAQSDAAYAQSNLDTLNARIARLQQGLIDYDAHVDRLDDEIFCVEGDTVTGAIAAEASALVAGTP